jgi:hypothetical protein
VDTNPACGAALFSKKKGQICHIFASQNFYSGQAWYSKGW